MISTADRVKRLYGSGTNDLKQPITSFVSSERARLVHANDREKIAVLENSSAQMEAFGEKKKMTSTDMSKFLSAAKDYAVRPRSKSAQESTKPRTDQLLAEKYGGTEAAKSAVERSKKFLSEAATDVGYLANLKGSGIGSDLEVIELAAKYG